MTRSTSVTAEELQVLVQYQLVAALQQREDDLAEAQRLVHLGSWSWDMTTGVVTWSDELYRIFGVGEATIAPSLEAFLSFVHPDDRATVEATVQASYTPFGFEYRIRRPDGEQRWSRGRGEVELNAAGVAVRMHGMVQDITEQVVVKRELADLSRRFAAFADAASATADPATRVTRDSLTGLANHALFVTFARQALARAARQSWATAVLVIDIDRFSNINDAFGHHVGDEVLVRSAARLAQAFRASDMVGHAGHVSDVGIDAVARFGGDRFVVVCENVADAAVLARRVVGVLGEPIALADGTEVTVTAGVGVAIAGPAGAGLEQRILDAEAALGRAKQRGRGQCEVVAEGMATSRSVRIEAEQALQRAIDHHELRLHYQAKVALDSDRITGAEALLRWEDPARGLVPPLEFIPLAESTGLIVPIGTWVIEEACRQAAQWQRRMPRRPPLAVSVNVSARQFGPELIDTVAAALAAAGTDPRQLCLEVTESVLISDTDAAIATLAGLAALGVKLSIDDFGTGFSSLSYLKRFPLDELKVDKSFVDGLGHDTNDNAIVAATVAMAHALNLSVVAEGVETADQLARLRVLGCQEVQGYFISRPGPATTFAQLVADEGAGRAASPTAPHHSGQRHGADRVLVVDDSAEVRQLARMTLAAVGFAVFDAEDGADAIAAAHQTRPDCVVLDVSMPGLSGTEVCRALRADPVTAGCTIVMLTSGAGAAAKVEAFSCGADDYIIKPFAPRDLVSRVREAMRHRSELGASVEQEDILDPVIVANLRSLVDPGDTKGARALIEMFLQAAPPRLEELRAAIENEDAPAIAALAHGLRGISASFGARQLAQRCERIEALATEAPTTALGDLFADAEHDFDRSRAALCDQFPDE